MTSMPAITVGNVEAILLKTGWKKASSKNRDKYIHPTQNLSITVPIRGQNSNAVLAPGTVREVFQQAGLGEVLRQLRAGEIQQKFTKYIKGLSPEDVYDAPELTRAA